LNLKFLRIEPGPDDFILYLEDPAGYEVKLEGCRFTGYAGERVNAVGTVKMTDDVKFITITLDDVGPTP
jgi:hypothetical protein